MPTGYTNELDTKDMTTQDWFLRVLPRAFGVCVTLRDYDLNMSEEEILKHLETDSSVSYYKKAMKEKQNKLEMYKKMTEAEWVKLWEFSEKSKKDGNEERVKKAKIMADRHEKVISDLKHLYISDVSPTAKAIARFGIEQLNEVKDECEPYIVEPQTLDQFRDSEIKAVKRSYAYDKEELAKNLKRQKERIAIYQQLQKDAALLGNKSTGSE